MRTNVCPYWEDRHPDHSYTSKLVTECVHLAALRFFKFDKYCGEPWKTQVVLYTPHHEFINIKPSFFVDITQWMEAKKELMLCYKSQLYDSKSKEPETWISRPNFLSAIEAQARMYGELIGTHFAEGYIIKKSIKIDDPVEFFN